MNDALNFTYFIILDTPPKKSITPNNSIVVLFDHRLATLCHKVIDCP